MEKTRILIAEDDESLVTYLESLLAEMGYQVSGWEAAGQAAILAAQEQQPDLILMDIHLRGEMSGIHAEDLSKLFKSFVQLDSSLSRQHSGTGLGLALVQKMAELQGGSVEVESAPGTGSRFTIILPWSKREIELNGARGGIISPQSVVLWPQENRLKPPGSFS